MTFYGVAALLVGVVLLLNVLLVWVLCLRNREPTEYDRRMEAHDMRLDDIARGSGRR